MSLLAELKRRNVVRVAVLYVITAWVVLQLADVLVGVLDLPHWAGRLVLALLALGLPIALVFAWVYEITPQGLRRQRDLPRGRSAAAATRRKLDIGIGVVAVTAILLILVDRLIPEHAVPPASGGAATLAAVEARSIAVLPFADMSQEKDQEYFADGLSEELMSLLARVEDLRVIGRTSAFQFKGRREDLRTIGRTLGVAHILDGSVRKSGRNLRITAQLIRAADGSQLWSATYNRELREIFALQGEIADAVVAALRLRLAAPDSLPGRAGRDFEAYDQYLLGKYQLDLRTPESLDAALAHFQAALARDPRDALAWVGLAETYSARAGHSSQMPLQEGYERARDAVERALGLDPALAAAYATLCDIQSTYDWDWKAADDSIQRALQLAPHDSRVLMKAANLDTAMGRLDRAIARYREAIGLDPLRAGLQYNLARIHLARGHFADAERFARRAVELSPGAGGVHLLIAQIRLAEGRPAEAQAALALDTSPVWKLYGNALIAFAGGRSGASDAAVAQLAADYGNEAAYQVAEVHAFRGERDLAFEWLERAYHQRDGGLIEIRTSAYLGNLRADPRFGALLAKLGLPPTA